MNNPKQDPKLRQDNKLKKEDALERKSIVDPVANIIIDRNDRPVGSIKEDKLKRKKIVDSIVQIIEDADTPHSLTIGIEGPWGSGKTSIINFVREELGEVKKGDKQGITGSKLTSFINFVKKKLCGDDQDNNDSNKYIIMDFNPWMYQSQEQLLREFFLSINETIKDNWKALWDNQKGKFSEFAKQFLKYAGGVIKGTQVSFSIPGVSIQVPIFPDLEEPSIRQHKEELDKSLSKFKKKIICIIDDIDRLDVDETLLIFKLTKIIADFPNIIFLLAYDRQRTAELISQKFNPSGNPNVDLSETGDFFIRKIVQVARPVPYSTEDIMKTYFFELLNSSKLDGLNDIELRDELVNTYDGYLKHLMQTPRDIKRFFTHIDLFLAKNKSIEIDTKNLILVDTLRISANKTYEQIKASKKKLIFKEKGISKKKLSGYIPIISIKTEKTTSSGILDMKEKHYLTQKMINPKAELNWPNNNFSVQLRCKTIEEIILAVPIKDKVAVTYLIMSLLSGGATQDTSNKQDSDITEIDANRYLKRYEDLDRNWDLYFSSGMTTQFNKRKLL